MLFRISLAIFHLMQSELLECNGMHEILKKLEGIPSLLQDSNLLIQVMNLPQYKIKDAEI